MLPMFVQKRLAFFIAPKHAAFWGALESVFFTALIFLLAKLLPTEDPLFLEGLRWAFLLPIIFALRYGSTIGAFSVFNLFLSWLIFREMGYYQEREFPQSQYIVALAVTMIAGEFADYWRDRLLKAEGEAVYILEKLESLTKRHVLLRLSHDRLEENLLIRPYTVREVLLRLREVTSQHPEGTVLPGASDLLDLIADYCQVKRAAIYLVENELLVLQPMAMLGEVSAIQKSDELVQHCLDYKRLAHIQMERGKAGAYLGPYLACAPIANSRGETIGLLTVENLPFLSINYDNFQLLGVLLGWYADLIHNRDSVQLLRQRWSNMSYLFAQETIALSALQMNANIETSLVILKSNGSELAEQVIRMLVDKRRDLDLYWYIEQQPTELMLMLPMTGSASFVALEQFWQSQVLELFLVENLHQVGISYAQRLLTEKPISEQIDHMQQVINEQ